MERQVYCRCSRCNKCTLINNINDEYIICESCHSILNICGDLCVNGIGLSLEKEKELISSLNKSHKGKHILLEGDDLYELTEKET